MILSDKESINRLGIFFFYDKDGIVDDYVPYLLNDMKKNVTDLLVVCNGKLTPEGRDKLLNITKDLIVRENVGFDVWAYKAGLEYFGWKKIEEYDEVVMFNFTIFGPLYEFKFTFEKMNKKDLDFWGITTYQGADFDPFGIIKYGYLPEHIQSHFIAVRNNMLRSYEFQKYWDNMCAINSYEEAICYHEAIFTKDFSDKGFKWDTSVDISDMKKHSHATILMAPLELVKNRDCPIVKRRSFFHENADYLNYTTGEQSLEIFEYIKKHTNYDVNMIWDNILRVNNQSDIKQNLHLTYILPTDQSKIVSNKKRVALVIHIYFEDLIDYCYEYASSMVEYADVYITTNSDEKKDMILEVFSKLKCNKLEVFVIENRGRDVSALLVATKDFIMDYDYVCFAHDKKSAQVEPYSIGESFSYRCFENILHNSKFVENILATFEENPRLGLLTAPTPNHAHFYSTIGTEWGNNFEITKGLAEKLKLKVSIDSSKEPIAPLGTMFWFRPKALKTLFDVDWEYKDFPAEPNLTDGTLLHAIERIYPFVVQHEGFYPAWVMNDRFAKIEVDNLHYMLRKVNMAYFKQCGPTIHYNMVNNMNHTIQYKNSLRNKFKSHLKRTLPKPIFNSLKKIKLVLFKR